MWLKQSILFHLIVPKTAMDFWLEATVLFRFAGPCRSCLEILNAHFWTFMCRFYNVGCIFDTILLTTPFQGNLMTHFQLKTYIFQLL